MLHGRCWLPLPGIRGASDNVDKEYVALETLLPRRPCVEFVVGAMEMDAEQEGSVAETVTS